MRRNWPSILAIIAAAMIAGATVADGGAWWTWLPALAATLFVAGAALATRP
jgi:hypothetical protein